MITLDYALRIYTDNINSQKDNDMEFFKQNLSMRDFEEFKGLISYINLICDARSD